MPNIFKRAAFAEIDYQSLNDKTLASDLDTAKAIMSGGDMYAFVNARKIGNLESITWSISVEVAAQFVLGRRDAVQYTQGKRVIVGSMMLAQYNQHAFLEEVWQLSKRGINALKDMWDPGAVASNLRNRTPMTVTTTTARGVGSRTLTAQETIYDAGGLMRGLSRTEYQAQQQDQARQAADLRGAEGIAYSDQIPPFDLSLVGVTKTGQASRCTIRGMIVNQETGGVSMQDLGNSAAFSFVALHMDRWRELDNEGNAAVSRTLNMGPLA